MYGTELIDCWAEIRWRLTLDLKGKIVKGTGKGNVNLFSIDFLSLVTDFRSCDSLSHIAQVVL